MNIAIVSYHTMGGSGIVAYELGAAFAGQGHKVHFLGLHPPFRMENAHTMDENIMFHSVDVKEYPVFTYPPYTLSLASRLFEVIERYNIDVVHCHYAVPHAVAGLLAVGMTNRDVTVITTLHGTDITLVGSNPSFFSVTRHAIVNSDCVTAVSQYLKQKTVDVFDIDDNSITVIPNFVDPDSFNPDLNRGCQIEKRCNKHIIVHASNLREVKQPLDLLDIFKQVKEDLNEPCELWILGDGPKKCEMERYSEKYGLEHDIFFFGITGTPGLFFSCADIFLMTSREESFGLAALESMACSTAVVAYNTGGLVEVVTHGETGFLCENRDIDTMAHRCVELFTDPDLLKDMKKNALKRALDDFDKDRIVQEYLKLCR